MALTSSSSLPLWTGWLLTKNRRTDAIRSLRRLRGKGYPEEAIEKDVVDIIQHIELERRAEHAGWADLFRGTNRRRTLIICGLMFCQEYAGAAFIATYGTYFFAITGIPNPFLAGLLLNIIGLVGNCFLLGFLKTTGRRPMMIYGGLSSAICMLIVAIVGVADAGTKAASRVLLAFILLYTCFFAASWVCAINFYALERADSRQHAARRCLDSRS